MISPLAYVHPDAKLGKNVTVEPFAYIAGDVEVRQDGFVQAYVKDLEAMGVASLKLEGRMKRPEYVASVTQVYRRAIDSGIVTRDMEKQLLEAFNRQGFTDGYYKGQTGSHLFGIRD